MKFLKWMAFIFVLLIGVGGVVSYLWVRHYIYSDHFTEDMVKLGSDKLDGEFTLEDFDPENWAFKAGKVGLKKSGKIENLEVTNLEAYFNKYSLLKKVWHMRAMRCDELVVHIKRKKYGEEEKVEKKKVEDAETAEEQKDSYYYSGEERPQEKKVAKKEKRKPFIHKIIPNDLQFETITVGKSTGSVERRKRDIEWEGVSLKGEIKKKSLAAVLSGGNITIPFKLLPKWNVDEVDLNIDSDFFTINSSQFTHEHGGSAKIKGDGDFSGDNLLLESEFIGIPITSLVDEPDYTTIKGLVNGKVKAFNQGDDTFVKGQLYLSGGSITLPKLLKPIVKLLGEGQSETITLNQCVGDVRHIGKNTTIENIYIESEGLFSLTGRIELVNDFYRGLIRFGVSEEMKERLPKRLTKNMEENNRFYYVPVRLEGKKDDFTKDMTYKIARSLGGAIISEDGAVESLQRNVSRIIGDEEMFEPIKEKADDLINKGLNALEKLFK